MKPRTYTEKKFSTIATKVSAQDYDRLRSIAKSFGMTFYQLLQALILCLLRLSDNGSAMSAECLAMLQAFEGTMQTLDGSYNPVSNKRLNETEHIQSAILFVKRGKHKRPQLKEVGQGKSGMMWESYNTEQMFSRFLDVLCPDVTEALRAEQSRMGYACMTQALRKVVLQSVTPAHTISEDVAELFTDNWRAGNTKVVEYSANTKSTHHLDIDGKAATKIMRASTM